MSIILSIVKLLPAALSLLGIALFVHRKLGINPAFLPIFSVSTVSVITFTGGLFGFLLPTVYILYAVGILLLAWTVSDALRGKYSPSELFTSSGCAAFLVFSLLIFFCSREISLLHVDNFSHWGVIVKEMCLRDTFPIEGTAVTFRNYAPGSSAFIYFVCRLVGFTEANAVAAQGLLLSSAISAIFCRTSIKNVVRFVSLSGAALSTLVLLRLSAASLSIYNLLVDTLIAFVTVAAGVIVYAYRRDTHRLAWTLTPVLAMLVITKNSARLFAISLTLLALYYTVRTIASSASPKIGRRFLPILGTACVIPLQFILPWAYDVYAKVNFPLHVDKFPTTVSGILNTIKSKDNGYLRDILGKIMTELRSTDTLSAVSVKLTAASFVIAVVVLALTLILRKDGKLILTVFTIATVAAVAYMAELYVLYAFIFPEAEAVILASFYRYLSTGAVIVSLPLLAGSIYQLSLTFPSPRPYTKAAALILSVAVAVLSLITVRDNLPLLTDPLRDEDTRTAAEARRDYAEFYRRVSEKIPPDSFLIVYTTDTAFSFSIMPQYELETCHCLFIYPYMTGNEELITARIDYPEYFIVHSDYAGFESLMTSRGFTLIGGESDVYRVDRDSMTLTAK